MRKKQVEFEKGRQQNMRLIAEISELYIIPFSLAHTLHSVSEIHLPPHWSLFYTGHTAPKLLAKIGYDYDKGWGRS
jgi:hypothetical protein